ncbi:hypothetical protein LWI29_003129 [Acer saccharum]|uniref:F-box domain-containing protein n=1 Tax=Acer saccharum TaxID=4024 RepID=A0AA39SB58_ACESA|nr:hypothetical protein LWI29_003129 [Acer saccharum]
MDIKKKRTTRRQQQKDDEDFKRNNGRNWSRIPENILAIISDKLSLCDYLSFSNVCISWRSFILEEILHDEDINNVNASISLRRRCGFPWLVMSHDTSGTESRSCFSVLQNKSWQKKLPNSNRSFFWGSFQDWLVMVTPFPENKFRLNIFLLNPFSGIQVLLPETSDFYNKLLFSGDPSKQTCIYLLLSFCNEFALWVPGERHWCTCYFEEEDDNLTDAILFDGCFYFLTRDFNIRVIDVACSFSIIEREGHDTRDDTRFYDVEMPLDIPRMNTESVLVLRYLMEFCGEIILILRFSRNHEETHDFKIFRLDLDQLEWVKLDSLGDRVLFLGGHCSRSYSEKELGVGMANCIYFTNEFLPMFCITDWHPELSCSDSDDFGIFRLNFDSSESFSYHAKTNKMAPVWLNAPLWWYFQKPRF